MRYNESIEQRLADRRDRLWGRAMMGRHSTIAGRRLRSSRDARSLLHAPLLWARMRWGLGKLLISLGHHLGAEEIRPTILKEGK